MQKVLISIILVVAGVAGFLFVKYGDFMRSPTFPVSEIPKTQSTQENAKDAPRVSVLAQDLEIPWSLVFLPDGSIVFTERAGRVRRIDGEGNLNADPILEIDEVEHVGEGGLLGVEIHPDFKRNEFIYFYYTYDVTQVLNRVVRYKFNGENFSDRKVIVDAIPGATFHHGGRLKFGPDGFLYITTGDAQEPSLAQDTNSLAGKILRVDYEGSPAPGNPFGNRVYSYGHRNPQGLAWDNQGRLWATEHGNSATDELNLIESGRNYGWPTIRGSEIREEMVSPIIQSGNNTWAPSGTAFFEDSLFFAGLRGTTLFEAKIDGESVELSRHFEGEFGRLRDVVVGPDGIFYVLTNNRDGRGRPIEGDDKILTINPSKL